MTKILGLDLGTNSIGWALVERDTKSENGRILGLGSRIIPMTQDVLDGFGSGKPTETQTAARTRSRGARRLYERHHLRRERLHRVLNILGFLPEHYAALIDFEKHFGQFTGDAEPKLPWRRTADGESEFIFDQSFSEMLEDFRKNQPQLLVDKKGGPAKVPYDWTIYYLRKKALTQKIEKEELAWLILNFNQKRGYYQLRGEEEEENPNKSVEYHSLKIVDVTADEKPNSKGEVWYSLRLDKGWVYRRSSKTPLYDWKDKVRDFIVTTDLDDSGNVKTDKEGAEKRSFRAPGEEDWTLLKKKTETDVERSGKTLGAYIYDALLQDPSQKIRGKLVRTVERKFYRDELRRILEKQREFHPELRDEGLYADCVRELYRNNEAHRLVLDKRDAVHLLLNDILFYHRPLRSQKSTVGNCTLEYREYRKNGVDVKEYMKAVPKSNPYYQEFRIWQWLRNLAIYGKDDDRNALPELLSGGGTEDLFGSPNVENAYEGLFNFLNTRKEIEQKPLIKHLLGRTKAKVSNAEIEKYRWNYVEDKKYPCNETGCEIRRRMEKVEDLPADFITREIEQELWHIIYSVTDKAEFEKALKRFANRHKLDEASFVEAFRKFPPFKSEYGAQSEKAIKRLLPLMRMGKHWSWDAIDPKTRERIDKLLTGEYDETIPERVREKVKGLTHREDFRGLPLWLAQYVVYGRHSESGDAGRWDSVEDLDKYLKEFRQHSLRNPIVEQVVTETLRVVGDAWRRYGRVGEIHVELGREMKNTAEERKKRTDKNSENENTNLRIKALLMELKDANIENVRPWSPMQHDILKIYEEYALQNDETIDDDILKISRTAQPTKSELQRYKLWLEQRYRSPYTGEMIPLGKLFTEEYQIEHVIPKSRWFDDGFNNKVICEAAVNQLKDSCLGLEFIKKHHGQIVPVGLGKTVKVFNEEEYKHFVQEHYTKNRKKRNNLLLEDIPEKMIERQMNDTRYISRFISAVLSNIVRDEEKDDGMNSKNVVPCNGTITTALKKDWGLNDVWNELILPRFERMNELTKSGVFTAWNAQYQKFLPTVPMELSKGFQKKRIDHRHHAMDALVIACATRDHVNLMNNQEARSDNNRHDLKHKLMRFERVSYFDRKTGKQVERDVPKDFTKPWPDFTADAKDALGRTVVSFKQNLRVINKATNRYEKWVEKDGKKVKELVNQEGVNWAIRKPLHKDTVYGKVDLKWVKMSKREIATATRKALGPDTDLKKITDTGIQKTLANYLRAKDGDPQRAFSPEGIEEMNRNIGLYNGGRPHKPILKVRIYEVGSRFALGTRGSKGDKYVEAAKGTNLFFAVYADAEGNRSYETIPLNEVIERLKQGLKEVPDRNGKGHELLFHLSPNDLVYVPTEEERENIGLMDWNHLNAEQMNQIYKIVSFSNSRLYAIPVNVATSIVNKAEFTQMNKIEFIQEKKVCIKLNIDRLGNIEP